MHNQDDHLGEMLLGAWRTNARVVMAARQLGHRVPSTLTGGLWQWTVRSHER